MPIHDWSRVPAGIFHHFHHGWITTLKSALNGGRLPDDHYALAERTRGFFGPEGLSLLEDPDPDTAWPVEDATTEITYFLHRQNGVVVRHSSDDRVVAIIEVVSRGNKSSEYALQKFVEKAAAALDHGVHLLILDLQAPTSRDPQGIHGAIWNHIEADSYQAPPDRPLTLAAYAAGDVVKTAYVEPVAVGATLPEMPLFLRPESYVGVPLEATYQAAWRGVPRRWLRELGPTE